MIKHTKAFKRFRDLSQGHINFVVLTCYSVPLLKATLEAPGAIVPTPDHFKGNSNDITALLGFIASYQNEIARSTLITVFSYFEAYLKSALQEVIEFHGGKSEFQRKAKNRAERFFRSVPATVQANKRKLQDIPNASKQAKYEKFARLLEQAGFRFPTDLLSHFGVTQLILKADDKLGFKAHEIPSVLKDALLYPLTTAEKEIIERIRLERNGIAHGGGTPIRLATSLRDASSLHTLAAAVDHHIVDHFFLIQQP